MPDNRSSDPLKGGGQLPDWTVSDLPAPPAFNRRNLLKVIGPGAILLATSIGGGEWLVGPAAGVRFGTGVMWIATIAIGLQLIFNLEGIRYTLYTGEPIYAGFMRLKPGSAFWGASTASSPYSSWAGRRSRCRLPPRSSAWGSDDCLGPVPVMPASCIGLRWASSRSPRRF